MIDFIGIGAQKSGTSWAYANLYEHPEICAPIKEIHFFSRERFSNGKEWYEDRFKRCKNGLKQGEFSTSYLYSREAPGRIKEYYPDVKLIAILRNPLTRAVSQYKNALKAGEISEDTSFDLYVQNEKSVLDQGKYFEQLSRYLELFDREQLQILIYEDIDTDPAAFMKTIYTFLGVDPNFTSSMLHQRINVARNPKSKKIERIMHTLAESLRKIGFDTLVHTIRKSGAPDLVRKFNTKEKSSTTTQEIEVHKFASYFKDDVEKLSHFLGRDLTHEWLSKS